MHIMHTCLNTNTHINTHTYQPWQVEGLEVLDDQDGVGPHVQVAGRQLAQRDLEERRHLYVCMWV